MSDELFATHRVKNQPPPLQDYNLYRADTALQDAVTRGGGAWAHDDLADFGETLGRAETIEWGRLANRNPPILHGYDRYGATLDTVEFHPAWHEMMALGVGAGVHAAPWAEPKPGAHVARAAKVILLVQAEAGVQCPITMTYGVVPALRRQPDIAAEWLPRIYSRRYDRRFLPEAQKTGALMGMGLTEKQGGSDLRANETRATPLGNGGPGQPYRLVGHKWFMSAPMCDAFLVLAQTQAGPSCFFLPRFTPDGEQNALRLRRLKDKLGNRSNASAEVEFENALGWLVGEEGRGIPTLIEMATYTRLDCALGSTGLMRQAVAQAIHHAGHRAAFGKNLVDQPAMTILLADLALEAEAAMQLALRLARAFDREDDAGENAFRRLMTPAAKFFVCKRAIALAGEAMEVLGGNGYVEESIMPRLYREMPVNSIWEGSGNIMALDVLRALQRTPDAVDALRAELAPARGADRRFDRFVGQLDALLAARPDDTQARRLTEMLVLAVQGALLLQHSTPAVADAFCAGRCEGWSGAFGTLPAGIDGAAIVARAAPRMAS
ncbi:MAG TPA: isovaleryl-CoA dehydrogenase [Stellaceae bacterium]|jgi:putative acyl-CoA dehydrogenase|nr:isovaleryl-CoA dehydrogenase [Stellaceae bacterium]